MVEAMTFDFYKFYYGGGRMMKVVQLRRIIEVKGYF